MKSEYVNVVNGETPTVKVSDGSLCLAAETEVEGPPGCDGRPPVSLRN